MRYLVFGDVHGNLVALEAVLEAAEQRGVNWYLFVGDAVGYGPQPLECLERLGALQEQERLVWVVGNHELVLRGELPSTGYNEQAERTLEWTRGQVEKTRWAKDFLRTGHLIVQVEEAIWLTHDSVNAPTSGHYHHWPQNAKTELTWLEQQKGRVAFYGHTHMLRAELLREGGAVILAPMFAHEGEGLDRHPLRLKEKERAWVGVGSVGFPTNSGRLAEFLILDDEQWHVEKYAVPYSREKARASIRKVVGPACGKEIAEQIARWL